MEVFLHLWDELDDLASLCRHAATATAGELLSGAASFGVSAAALGIALLAGASRLLSLAT
jgi:hypothetical protein